MQESRDPDKLYQFFSEVICGTPVESENTNLETEKIIQVLYGGLLSTSEQLFHKFDLPGSLESDDELKIIKEIYELILKVEPEDCSFYPLRMLESGKATCAGQTLLVNMLFQKAGIQFEYGRLPGHSMNFAYIGDKTYWVDSANGVFTEILYDDEVVNGVKIRRIDTDHPKIPYRIARVLKPEQITIAIFGNFLALMDWAQSESNPIAIEIYEQNADSIEKIDLEYWLFYLFKDVMEFSENNKEFVKEVERIKKLGHDAN